MSDTKILRCGWGIKDPLMQSYHDAEWGVPKHDDRRLFEDIVLDGAQAGLSWATILRKRENYRKAFDNFDVRKIARYTERKIQSLMHDEGIIRNRLKIESAVKNARACAKIQDEFGTFDTYLWKFVDGTAIINRWKSLQEIPVRTKESDAMSKDLNRRGFTFVGSTICYAFMQAVGMANDHIVGCYRHDELSGAQSVADAI